MIDQAVGAKERSCSLEEVGEVIGLVAVMELPFDLDLDVGLASLPFVVAFAVELVVVAGDFVVGGVGSFQGRVGNVVVAEELVEVVVAAVADFVVAVVASSGPASSTISNPAYQTVD